MLVALAVDRMDFHDEVLGLAAIGTGIHAQGAADGAGNAVVELEAGNAMVERHCGDVLVRADAAGLDRVVADEFDIAETLGRQADHDTGNAAVAHQKALPPRPSPSAAPLQAPA